MGHKNRFEFLVILMTVTLIAITTINNNISSTKIGSSHGIVIINYAHAQTEVKVSIVSGASTLAEKGYSPNPVNIKSGDNVTWINDDTVFHTVTNTPFYGGKEEIGKLFDSGLSGPTALTTKGKTFSHKFTEKGQYPYFCQLHPTMVGKVSVS